MSEGIALMKGTTRVSHSLSAKWGHKEKTASYGPGGRASPDSLLVLELGSSASRTVSNKCCLSHAIRGIPVIAAGTDENIYQLI